jgi:tRNA pseudouridine55 synthase
VARAVFGVATDSLDTDGAILARSPMDVTQLEVEAVMTRFVGTIAQIPPMVSARKVGGRKLYELAREGVEIEREARDVEIYRLELVEFAPSNYPEVVFRTVCSTGTYVRTLGDDMAQALGGRAHLSALRRVRNGSLHVDNALGMGEVEAAVIDGNITDRVLSPRDGLPDIPEIVVADDIAAGVRNGLSFPARAFDGDLPENGPIRVVNGDGSLGAIYRVESGRAAPEVVLA